jgi:hypothetical protein
MQASRWARQILNRVTWLHACPLAFGLAHRVVTVLRLPPASGARAGPGRRRLTIIADYAAGLVGWVFVVGSRGGGIPGDLRLPGIVVIEL